MDYYLGLDLGGTKIKAGIANDRGRIIAQLSAATRPNPEDCIADMVEASRQLSRNAKIPLAKIKAVGILAPGQASLQRGIVFKSANMPRWTNVPIRAHITKALKVPGVLENDANAAAYGEFWAGAGKGNKYKNLVMFTFGTGVGGGIILDGRVLRGDHDIAAELGHMIIEPGGEACGCGQHGCLETYTSAKYTAQRAMDLLRETAVESSLRPVLQEGKLVTALDIQKHAKKGDHLAMQVWNDTCFYIALGCINTVHWLDPQIILLGGGMSEAGRFLLDKVQLYYKQNFWKMMKSKVKIELALLGNDAGIIGAAGVAKDALHRKTAVMG